MNLKFQKKLPLDWFKIFWAVLSVWCGKILFLRATEARADVQIGLLLCVVTLNLLSLKFLFAATPQLQATHRYRPWRNALLVSFAFASIQILPLAPDMYLAFEREQGWLPAVGSIVAMYFFTLVVFTFVRTPALCLGFRILRRRSHKRAGFALLFSLLVMHIVEFVVFVTVPVLYWEAYALPVPLAAKHTLARDGESRDVVISINPQITDSRRTEIFQNGHSGVTQSAHEIGRAIGLRLQNDLGVQRAQSVTVLLPETMLFLSSDQFLTFFRTGYDELQKHRDLKSFAVLMGAKAKGLNRVYFGNLHNGEFSHGVYREKETLVPLFEKPVLGLSTRTQSSPEGHQDGRAVSSFQSKVFSDARVSICYEALDLSRWRWKTPHVVFTNHFIFMRPGLASRLYDVNLRLLGFFYRAPLLLVGNFGDVGMYLGSKDAAWNDVTALNITLPGGL